MIKVTLEFANQAELLAYFSTPVPEKVKINATAPDAITITEKVNTSAKPVKETAKSEHVEAPKAAAVSTAQAPTPAPAASPSAAASPTVDYPTLQKAVFALANASREAASEVAASFNVKTFKALSQDQWAPALTAVNAKLESLKVAA